jgi:hypothetical protein
MFGLQGVSVLTRGAHIASPGPGSPEGVAAGTAHTGERRMRHAKGAGKREAE